MILLRLGVALLLLLHVGLIAQELQEVDLLAPALWAVGAMLAAGAAALGPWYATVSERTRSASRWSAAVVDALALVAVARMTVEIDPSASLAWAFVLWVPFSVAAWARSKAAAATAVGVALLVYASTRLSAGSLDALPMEWGDVGVPVGLVVVAGVATILVTRFQHLGEDQARSQLVDERDRTLRLREADELKNTFLAAVSHELRTPLTSILGFSLTLLDRPELDQAQRERMLRTVVTEAEHLEDILANLLDLDRLTRGKATVVPSEVDPAALVRTAVAHATRRGSRGVTMDLAPGLSVVVDSGKVERIVENLVGNALKYTPDGAQILVSMRTERDGILIRVDDAGPGIPQALRETIFEPFRRGDDIGVPGTGIGLSLVEKFAGMHGGRATVEERPGGGCRFDVYLPSLDSADRRGRGSDARQDRSNVAASTHGSSLAHI